MRFVFTWLPCWSKKHHYLVVYRGSKFMHFDKSCAKMSQNHTSNLDKVFLNVPPSSDFGLEARILQIGWFYRPKWKKVEKSASKNKHPIKLRFLIWRLQSANPEKKVIPENQGFGSCPLQQFAKICTSLQEFAQVCNTLHLLYKTTANLVRKDNKNLKKHELHFFASLKNLKKHEFHFLQA